MGVEISNHASIMLIVGAPRSSSRSIRRGNLLVEAFGGEMVGPFRKVRPVSSFLRRLVKVK